MRCFTPNCLLVLLQLISSLDHPIQNRSNARKNRCELTVLLAPCFDQQLSNAEHRLFSNLNTHFLARNPSAAARTAASTSEMLSSGLAVFERFAVGSVTNSTSS